MRDKMVEDVDIKGLVVSLYAVRMRNGTRTRMLLRRRLVSPDFIELYYKILAKEPADATLISTLFNLLSDADKDFLSFLVNQIPTIRASDNGRKFQIVSNKAYQSVYTKVKMIEDGIKAGSINPQMFDEFSSLVKRLEQSGQVSKGVAFRMIRALSSLRVS